MNKIKRMWVSKEYHDQLKVESSIKGMSIIEYTKYLSNNSNYKDEKKKRGGFNFDF